MYVLRQKPIRSLADEGLGFGLGGKGRFAALLVELNDEEDGARRGSPSLALGFSPLGLASWSFVAG